MIAKILVLLKIRLSFKEIKNTNIKKKIIEDQYGCSSYGLICRSYVSVEKNDQEEGRFTTVSTFAQGGEESWGAQRLEFGQESMRIAYMNLRGKLVPKYQYLEEQPSLQ